MAVTPEELRQRREGLDLSLAGLGEQLGVPRNTIWRWETGRMTIQQPGLLDLALQQIEERAVKERQVIEGVASTLYDALATGLLTDAELREDAIKQNSATGWTIETSRDSEPGDTWVVLHQGVHLTPAQLDQALRLAQQWLAA